MKDLKRQFGFTAVWAFAVTLLLPLQASAITLLPPCTKTGDCAISDILVVLVNVAEFLLGISGAVALLFFVYGGYTMLISAGRPSEVEKGKTILTNAVIGIAIIFLSGVIVRFTTQALTGGQSRIPTVGESCEGNSGIYVTIPSGFTDPNNPSETIRPEEVMCIKKDDCATLKSVLEERNRTEAGYYACAKVGYEKRDSQNQIEVQVRSCVRGLCLSKPAGYACCLCENGDGDLITCPSDAL